METIMTTAVDNTPINKNFLSPLNFTFILKRSPHLNFFVQQINIPSITLSTFNQPTPTLNVPVAGDHLDYGLLNVTFKIDEDFKNYMEIHSWITALGYPDSFQGYRNLRDNAKAGGESLKSDISVLILNNIKNPNYEILYKDAFPIALTEASFQTTDDTVEYVSATATFKYTIFSIEKL